MVVLWRSATSFYFRRSKSHIFMLFVGIPYRWCCLWHCWECQQRILWIFSFSLVHISLIASCILWDISFFHISAGLCPSWMVDNTIWLKILSAAWKLKNLWQRSRKSKKKMHSAQSQRRSMEIYSFLLWNFPQVYFVFGNPSIQELFEHQWIWITYTSYTFLINNINFIPTDNEQDFCAHQICLSTKWQYTSTTLDPTECRAVFIRPSLIVINCPYTFPCT